MKHVKEFDMWLVRIEQEFAKWLARLRTTIGMIAILAIIALVVVVSALVCDPLSFIP